MGAVQLTGERLKVGLGEQWVRVVVGGPHPLGHRRGNRIGKPVGDGTELMELAALDDGVVEHVAHRTSQRLGAVDHHQDGLGHLQPAVAQPGQQVGHRRGVLGGASASPSGTLVPSMVIPARPHSRVRRPGSRPP
jgi:hypothetical protein